MMRFLFTIVIVMIAWQVLRGLLRSLAGGSANDVPKRDRLRGEEMVRDPECGTYIPKARAVSRSVNGRDLLFCCEDCGRRYAEKNRG